MNFISKNLGRLGKKKQDFTITVLIKTVTLQCNNDTTISVQFVRGPESFETANKEVKKSHDGNMVKVEFQETFKRTSGFYLNGTTEGDY